MKGLADSSTDEAGAVRPEPEIVPPPQQPKGGGKLARGPFVRVMTVVIIAVVIAEMSLVCWRWITVREPTSAVMLTGDASLDGTQIEVISQTDNEKLSATLSAENNYIATVLLQPGYYTVSATHKDRHILQSKFLVEKMKCIPYELPSAVVLASADATQDIKVTLDSVSVRQVPGGLASLHETIALNAGNHFRETAYLLPGTYRASAANSRGQVIASADFVVTRDNPIKVRLGQPLQPAD